MEAGGRWIALMLWPLVAGCSAHEVQCGDGTVLREGQCIVAKPEVRIQPPLDGAASVLDARVSATVPSAATRASWVIKTKHDAMRNKDIHLAALVSENVVEFPFPYNGGSHLNLRLLKGDTGSGFDLQASIMIEKGQFDCGSDGCSVSMKFDDGSVERWGMTSARGAKSDIVFFDDSQRLLGRVRSARRLIVEASFFESGRRQFTFEVPSLPAEALGAQAVPPTHLVKSRVGEVFCLRTELVAYCYAAKADCDAKARFLGNEVTNRCAVETHPPCSWGMYEDNCSKIREN